jgi:hypothetical protein
MSESTKTYALAGGELMLWAEPGCSVMIKVLSKGHDPIELGEGEIEELIAVLTTLSKEL